MEFPSRDVNTQITKSKYQRTSIDNRMKDRRKRPWEVAWTQLPQRGKHRSTSQVGHDGGALGVGPRGAGERDKQSRKRKSVGVVEYKGTETDR